MDLEEHTLPPLETTCEQCGTKLTQAEMDAATEAGGPFLCAVHADELIKLDEEEEETA